MCRILLTFVWEEENKEGFSSVLTNTGEERKIVGALTDSAPSKISCPI